MEMQCQKIKYKQNDPPVSGVLGCTKGYLLQLYESMGKPKLQHI